jgi:hypothetical protein
MKSRRYFWVSWATAHIVLVVLGACDRLPDPSRWPIVWPLVWYTHLSGADSQYSFYAPEVGGLHRARFTLEDSQGHTWVDSFEEANNPEARLRFAGITDAAFANGAAQESPERRNRLIKSWAATMFSRHPSARTLVVTVETHEIPTMAEFQAGHRPVWKNVYQAQVICEASSLKKGDAR